MRRYIDRFHTHQSVTLSLFLFPPAAASLSLCDLPSCHHEPMMMYTRPQVKRDENEEGAESFTQSCASHQRRSLHTLTKRWSASPDVVRTIVQIIESDNNRLIHFCLVHNGWQLDCPGIVFVHMRIRIRYALHSLPTLCVTGIFGQR